MSNEGLRYDRMVEDALRSVVRKALIEVAEHGLPGNHHFYITFRTDHKDADIPAALRERYPGEMTIVLQHQFWGLEIDEDQFCVTLSFSDVPHRLVVPFAAVTAFADPSVRFGLQFDVETAESLGAGPDSAALFEPPAAVPDAKGEPDEAERPEDGEEKKSGEKVVTLDAFRKK
ncbi:ClpXP protease specificity-enhancing factor SspB [Pelagibius sp. CAU 1746]|uniref:SspB family protein n=1 Tax=Pelagibius sp. CAU 1746 TaxID=3140370 RepID=UPI00325AD2FA